MGIINTPQTNFGRGELDQGLTSRKDIAAYMSGAQRLRNWSFRPQGGLRQRPGFRFRYDMGTADATFASFVFSDSQRYLFGFINASLKVFNESGTLLATVAGPWTTAMLPTLYVAQAADTMIVVHDDLVTQRIVRIGASTFTVGNFAYETDSTGVIVKQPYYKHADDAITMTPSATTGAITLTLSAAHWVAAHNGLKVRYKGKQLTITGYTSATVVNATVNETLPGVTADVDWEEPAFSTIYGYPRTVTFHNNRLIFGGAKSIPDGFFASRVGGYFNFDVGTGLDAEAISHAIGSEKLNEIRGMVSGRHLQIFTSDGPYYIPESQTRPMTPGNVAFLKQTPFGSAVLRPVEFDGAALFVQKNSNVVREFLYNDTEAAYSGDSVSLLSGQGINAPKRLEVIFGGTDQPDYFALLLNGDGTLGQFQSVRSEQIAGWAFWSTTGTILQICAVENLLFALVQRSINSVTKYYLESLEWAAGWELDCAMQVTLGSPGTAFTGFTHLASQLVHVMSGNAYLGTYTVSAGGVITLTEAATTIVAGLAYTVELKPMNVDVELRNGPATHLPKKIVSVTLDLADVTSLAVNGDRLWLRSVGEDLNLPPTPFAGRKRIWPQTGWAIDQTVSITMPEPGRATIKGLIAEVEV